MAAPILRLFDSLGVEVTAAIALGQASPGVPTAESVFTVRNNDAGAGAVDTAAGVFFVGTARVAGSGSTFVSAGNAFADARALEVRVRAFSGGATGTVTGFRASPVLLGTIPDGGQVEIGVRVRATAASATSDWELAFALEDNPVVAVKERLFQGLGNFVYDGRPGGQADPGFSAVYSKVGGLAPDSPADDSVDVWTTVVYAHEGVWRTYTGTEEVFNATDGDAATLASGEAYYATLSLGAAGTLTITKGSKGTAPLTDADKAAVPAGEILAGYVLVPFGLVIDTVEDVLALGFWALTVVSGLSIEIAAGQGAVGGNYARNETPTEATLADASTLTIWRTPTTGFEILASTADPSDLQSMPLWDVTTSGGAVTVTTDRRQIGPGIRSIAIDPVTSNVAVGGGTLFVNQSVARVGLGTSSPGAKLHVLRGGTPFSFDPQTSLGLQNTTPNAAAILSLLGADNSQIAFGDTANEFAGRIAYSHSLDAMRFFINGAERARIDSSGNLGVADAAPSEKLAVTGNIKASGTVRGVTGVIANGTKNHGALAAAPAFPAAGDTYYDTSTNKHRGYNGTTWNDFY